jgi:hypothetical protein
LSDKSGDQEIKRRHASEDLRRVAQRECVAVAVRPSEGPHGNSIVARRDARPSDVCQSSNGPANVSGMNYRQISGAKTCHAK